MSILKPFKMLYEHRHMLWQTTINEVKVRYAGSLLGLIWVILYPLLFLGAYAAVYIYVFNVRFELFNTNEYVALIFCGLIPFLGFSEVLSTGVSSVTSNSSLIKNTMFPIELVPVKAVLAAQTTQSASMVILLIVLGLLGKWSILTPLFLVVWFLQIMFSIGLVWIVSSINVFMRDLQNIISVVILLLMMVSPIAYPVEMVPANLRPFLKINPLYYIITSFQDTLMLGRFPEASIIITLLVMAFSFFIFGYIFFIKLKRVFADNV